MNSHSDAAARPQAVALNARRLEKNTLRGFFDLQLSSGLVLRSCSLHFSHGRWWVGMPAKPYKTAAGAEAWTQIVDFADTRTRRRFQEIALDAAAEAFPEVVSAAEQEPGAAP